MQKAYYGKYGFGGTHYLHYYGKNIENGMSHIAAILNASKGQILENAMTQWNDRVTAKAQEIAEISDMTIEEAGAFLSGDFFSGLSKVTVTEINGNQINIPNSIKLATDIINTTPEEVTKISQVVEMLQGYANEFFGQNLQTLKSDYAAVVIQEFAKSKNRMKMSNSVASSLLNSILGRYNEQFFRTRNPSDSSQKLDMAMKQILLILEGLPDLGDEVDKRYNYGVATAANKGKRATAKGESAIAKALLVKVQRWVSHLQTIVKEKALASAMITGEGKFKDAVEKMHAEIDRTGSNHKVRSSRGSGLTVGITSDVKISSSLQQYFKEVQLGEQALKNMGSRPQAKSDVSIFVNGAGAEGHLGITDKDYGIISEKAGDGVFAVSGDTKIQSNTPLLTLLVRELGLTNAQLHDVMQLAAAHDDTGGLDEQWNNLIENIKYSAFLDALTGMISSLDTNYFISLNGNIYTVSEFLTSFKRQLDNGAGLTMTQSRGSSKGLQRSSYVNLNQWRNRISSKPNYIDATGRSVAANQSLTQLLYNTKIQISINLNNLILHSKISGLY